ncbi:sulfotransferase domain-containing protein [Ditylenchus destructor]|nr:sulfotransferase domain-containing protein [Ditylenchus destructor]
MPFATNKNVISSDPGATTLSKNEANGQIDERQTTDAKFPAARQRTPDCLIIGVRKGGTRALLDSLALHPQIAVARKEVHFFDRDENYNRGKNWYKCQMPHSRPDQVVVEKTPAYFTNSQVPRRVLDFDPTLKIIIIVRDPLLRLISDFTQVYYTKIENNKTQIPLEEAIFIPNSTELKTSYKPVRNSLYSTHMRRWLEYFPLENFMIVDGDRFIQQPIEQLRLVEKFLGLPASIQQDQLVFNRSKGFYCFRNQRQRKPRCLGKSKGRKQIAVNATVRKYLRQKLLPYTQEFFAQIRTNFSSWLSLD